MSNHPSTEDTRAMLRPHDLLWLADTAGLSSAGPLPSWATPDWLAAAPVVMRREQVSDPDCIPVGLRGQTRSQRHPAYLSRRTIAKWVSPESLAAAQAWKQHSFGSLPALDALAMLAPSLAATGLAWGPTGSVGFALASGLPVLRPDSDLDLVVRALQPLTADQGALLLALMSSAPCRIDLQVETGHGAFALAEWASGHQRVLLKTAHGPLLAADPWRLSQHHTTDSGAPA